jgi:hypothetical protein
MSSVTRFIRQVGPSGKFLNAAVIAAAPATYCYEFTPASGNVVGNYPPGFMNAAGSPLQASISQIANNAGGVANLIIRDMGKTVKAQITNASGAIGFFRQVQLVYPQPLGFNSTNGVYGDAATHFLSFYVPIVIDGVAVVPAAAVAAHALCGQL